MKRAIFILTLFLARPVLALKTTYVAFDHPEGWKCDFTEGVWICQSTLDPDRKESLVMSIAALASEWDNIENFEDYLKQPREIKDDAGNAITSEISYTRRRNLNGHIWIDSLQHNSELPGFWTRYLATVNQRLAILITYIVSDEHYSKLAPQFERMVVSATLVNDSGGSVPSEQGETALPGPERLGPSTDLLKSRLNVSKGDKTAQPDKGDSLALPLIVLAAAVTYLVWRRKKKKAKDSGSSGPVEPKSPPAKEPTGSQKE